MLPQCPWVQIMADTETPREPFNMTQARWDSEMEKYKAEMHRYAEALTVNRRAVIDFGLAALRGIFVLNGAAAIAALTFLGHQAANKGAVAVTFVEGLGTVIWVFAAGAGLAVVATAVSYVVQRLVVSVDDAPDNQKRKFLANVSLSLAVGCATFGLSFFFVGIFVVLDVFEAAAQTMQLKP